MSISGFKKVVSTDRILDQVQDNVKQFSNQITNIRLLNGKLLEAITLQTGNNLIAHGLGRNYTAVFPSLPTTTVTVNETTSPDRSQYINITSSGVTTISLWVI